MTLEKPDVTTVSVECYISFKITIIKTWLTSQFQIKESLTYTMK